MNLIIPRHNLGLENWPTGSLNMWASWNELETKYYYYCHFYSGQFPLAVMEAHFLKQVYAHDNWNGQSRPQAGSMS